MTHTDTIIMLSDTLHLVCCVVDIVLRFLLFIMDNLITITEELNRLFVMFLKYMDSKNAVRNTSEDVSATLTDSNDTVGPSPIDRSIVPPTQSIVQPTQSTVEPTQSTVPRANTRYHPIRTDRPMDVKVWRYIAKVGPVESVKRYKEKINVVFNMMNERNLQTKCKEVRNIIVKTEDRCIPWLAQYIVMNRISIESNHHTLYFSFLCSLNNEKLNELITLETENNIIALLNRDRVSPMFKETLDNFGSWYGKMTLAKNNPISTTFGDLKVLLINAYYGGEEKLIYTLSLVVKILEACAKSREFNTTSLWTLDVLHCLSELHRQPDLKLTFQFEIEILCKKLKIELKDLKLASRYFTQLSRRGDGSGFRT